MRKVIRYRNFIIRILPTIGGFIFWKKNKKLSVDYMSYTMYPMKTAIAVCKKSIDRDWMDYEALDFF